MQYQRRPRRFPSPAHVIGRRRPQPRALGLIAGLVLALMLWMGVSASAAHAAEFMGCAELSADIETHSTASDSKAPGVPDDQTQHQHGNCHGHCFSLPSTDGILAAAPLAKTAWRIGSTTEPDSIAAVSDLRPPIA